MVTLEFAEIGHVILSDHFFVLLNLILAMLNKYYFYNIILLEINCWKMLVKPIKQKSLHWHDHDPGKGEQSAFVCLCTASCCCAVLSEVLAAHPHCALIRTD